MQKLVKSQSALQQFSNFTNLFGAAVFRARNFRNVAGTCKNSSNLRAHYSNSVVSRIFFRHEISNEIILCLKIELRIEIGFDVIVERGRVPHSLKKAEAAPAHEPPRGHSKTTWTKRGGWGASGKSTVGHRTKGR